MAWFEVDYTGHDLFKPGILLLLQRLSRENYLHAPKKICLGERSFQGGGDQPHVSRPEFPQAKHIDFSLDI